MKRLFILIAFAFLSTGALQAQWHEIQTGIHDDLYGVYCINADTAFVCGDNGVILKTEDGGETWVEKNRTDGVWLYNIQFFGNIGYANAGWYVYKTIDGGETWQPLNTESEIPFYEPKSDYNEEIPSYDLFMIDADTLYLFAGSLMKSQDSGISWFYPGGSDNVPFAGFSPYTSEIYFQDNVGYVLSSHLSTSEGNCLTVWKTTDYGNTWDIVYEIPDMENRPWGFASQFIDKDNMKIFPCYLRVDDGKTEFEKDYPMNDFYAIVTEDGFASYSIESVENNGHYGSITDSKFTDTNTGCYIAFQEWYGADCKRCVKRIEQQNFACITKDGGQTWQFCYDGLDGQKNLYGIDGIDTTFYIAASGGYVYRTGIPETIYPWYDDLQTINGEENDDEMILATPNPFIDKIQINGEISGTITLVDVTGNVLYEKEICANKHEINTSQYPSGIYTLRVFDKDGKEIVKKMVKTEK